MGDIEINKRRNIRPFILDHIINKEKQQCIAGNTDCHIVQTYIIAEIALQLVYSNLQGLHH